MTRRKPRPFTEEEKAAIKAKKQATWKARYPNGLPWQQRANKRRAATNTKRFGVAFTMQVPELFQKQQAALYKTEKIRVGSRVMAVRGYEKQAIEQLVTVGVPASAIKPVARAIRRPDGRVYFPDFVLERKGKKLYVEVKSTFTLGIQFDGDIWVKSKDKFEDALIKYRACEGDYLLMVMQGDRLLAATDAITLNSLHGCMTAAPGERERVLKELIRNKLCR